MFEKTALGVLGVVLKGVEQDKCNFGSGVGSLRKVRYIIKK